MIKAVTASRLYYNTRQFIPSKCESNPIIITLTIAGKVRNLLRGTYFSRTINMIC